MYGDDVNGFDLLDDMSNDIIRMLSNANIGGKRKVIIIELGKDDGALVTAKILYECLTDEGIWTKVVRKEDQVRLLIAVPKMEVF